MTNTQARQVDPLADNPSDPPRPSEVRMVLLTEHKHLRGLLHSVEDAARRVQRHNTADYWLALHERSLSLLGRLRSHMQFENRLLAPALRDTDAYGPLRARMLIEDHATQLGKLEANLMLLEDPGRAHADVADAMLCLAEAVRADMAEEERTLLDPELLRDDIVNADMFTG